MQNSALPKSIPRPAQLDYLRAAGRVVRDRDPAGPRSRCRGRKRNQNRATLAGPKTRETSVGLGKVPARRKARDVERGVAQVD